MKDWIISLFKKDKIVYIPAYVEQGVAILNQTKKLLNDIGIEIDSGIAQINGSGYDRGIPHIEKGDEASSEISQIKNTISFITSELEKYSNGEKILPDDAIIVADPATVSRYGLSVEDIDFTLSEYVKEHGVSSKWSSDYLTAAAGSIKYYGQDGRLTKETWCDLDPSNLATLMRKQGINLDFWIREDGVYMYGDYVMVAADIPHMDGTEQAAEYRKGDLVETSLGTGMVVDLCGMAEMVRKGELKGTNEGDVEVWYDIYTAWHDGGKYQHIGYCGDSACTSSYHGESGAAVISEREITPEINPTIPEQSQAAPLTTNLSLTENTEETSPQITEQTSPPTTQSSATSNANQTSTQNGNSSSNSSRTSSQKTYSHLSSNKNHSSSPTPSTSSQNTNKSSNTNTKSESTSISNVTSTHTQDTNETIVEQSPYNNNKILISSLGNTKIGNNKVVSENLASLNKNSSNTNEIPNKSTNEVLLDNNLSEEKSEEETYILPIINDNQKPETTVKSINSVPLLVSLGLTAAATAGAKVYMDNKSNEKKEKDN